MAQESVRVADIFARPIELIDPDPFNSRDIDSPVAREDIEEIARSILTRGFDPDRALLVRKLPSGRWMVTDGHKRRRAVLRAIELGAKIATVPCRSEERGTNDEARAILRLRAPGRELSPLEAATDIRRLMGWGWSDAKIAAELGKKPDWIARCLDLAAAPIEVRAAVRDQQISPTEARRVVKEHGSNAGAIIARSVDHARTEGRSRARPRDIAAVMKPRTDPVSLPTLVVAMFRAHDEDEGGRAFHDCFEALRSHQLIMALLRVEDREAAD